MSAPTSLRSIRREMARNAAKGSRPQRTNRGKGKHKPQPTPKRIIQFAQAIWQSNREKAA